MIYALVIFSSRNFSCEFGNSLSYFWGNDFCFFLLLVRLFGNFNLSILKISSHFKWVFSKWQKCGGILCCFMWDKWDGLPCLILNIFIIWNKWATTPNVCVIFPNSMIYLPVQFNALCRVLSGVILIFNTKCLIMPHTTLQCLTNYSYTKRYLFWSNLSSVTVVYSWYFINTSRKWLDEASIFSKLQIYENIHEDFSFSVTLKADFCNNVLIQIFSLAESCFIEIRALLPVTLQKELLQVRFLGISRTNTLQWCI